MRRCYILLRKGLGGSFLCSNLNVIQVTTFPPSVRSLEFQLGLPGLWLSMIGHSPRHCFLGKNFQEDCGKHTFIYVICVVQLYPRNYTTLWARSVKGKNLGLVMTDGDFQTRQKNFCMKQLKNFGFGKKDFESVILEQARELVKYLERHIDTNGRYFKPSRRRYRM